jgi:hypothetical protein
LNDLVQSAIRGDPDRGALQDETRDGG